MHTNNSMLRQFSWASNSLWPEDLKKNDIPSTIILAERDEIVPTPAVEELFSEFNNRNRAKSEISPVVNTFPGASHGDLFMMEPLRKDTANMIFNMIEMSRKNSINVDPIGELKKEYRALFDETAGEFWDQISYILPRAAGEQLTASIEK